MHFPTRLLGLLKSNCKNSMIVCVANDEVKVMSIRRYSKSITDIVVAVYKGDKMSFYDFKRCDGSMSF